MLCVLYLIELFLIVTENGNKSHFKCLINDFLYDTRKINMLIVLFSFMHSLDFFTITTAGVKCCVAKRRCLFIYFFSGLLTPIHLVLRIQLKPVLGDVRAETHFIISHEQAQ